MKVHGQVRCGSVFRDPRVCGSLGCSPECVISNCEKPVCGAQRALGRCGSPPAVSNQWLSLLQYLVCKRKLESKKEALLILSKELDTCQQERDQYKLMANQLRERHQSLKKKYRELIVSLAPL